MKVGENQSGLAKVATLDRGRQRRQNREGGRESYPLSGDLAQPPAADTTDRRIRPHGVADQSDEDGKRCFRGDKALKVGK